ncbi:uncharacterized protein LOC135226676 [Macrobrachium nipponense]|uniref:uncharacterized protein LOC135226676 n=1 Tax=Macrobrachium nipponense TaxID=159736 RepID=UPI0030C8891B
MRRVFGNRHQRRGRGRGRGRWGSGAGGGGGGGGGVGVLNWVTETAILVTGDDAAAEFGIIHHQHHQHPQTFLPRRNASSSHQGDEEQQHWNRLGMLLLVSTLAALGTLGNIFAIAAVMTEEHLKKKGNVLIVNMMLAGLVVSAGVLPTWVVALLAGWASPTPVCCASWLLTTLAAHCSLLTLPALAWENSARVAGKSMGVVLLTAMVGASWVVAGALTISQWLSGIGPKHCNHKHPLLQQQQPPQFPPPTAVHTAFTSAVGVVLVAAPLVVALSVHAHTLLAGRSGGPRRPLPATMKPPQALTRDLALTGTNLVVTAIVGGCWAAGVAGDWWASLTFRNGVAWLPVAAATSSGFLYAAHKPFREAYVQLFHYCCCKTSVSLSRRGRSGEAAAAAAAAVAAAARPASDVRVHIIPGYNMYTTASTREHRPPAHTHVKLPRNFKESRRPKHHHKKDVYEL